MLDGTLPPGFTGLGRQKPASPATSSPPRHSCACVGGVAPSVGIKTLFDLQPDPGVGKLRD